MTAKLRNGLRYIAVPKKATNLCNGINRDTVGPMNPMHASPRCGARTRQGRPCLSPAIRGKRRCRLHGGLSTGPRTAEGLERSRRARWKHGRYSREAREARAAERLTRPPTEADFQSAERRAARGKMEEGRRIRAALRRILGPA
jgi:hypothetical protein